jgi:glycosyltransferase involved in cell wall biosynthesis
VRELAARGQESRVAAVPRGRLAEAVRGLGLPLVPLPIANAADLRAGVRLRGLVAGHDVVHFQTARAHALAPLAGGRGARLVVTRRMDYAPRGGAYVRWLYNYAVDAVIAISDGVRRALVEAGVRADRIRVVPSGIDPASVDAPPGARDATRRGWGLAPDELAVVVLGALERRKGHAVLLAAAAREAAARPRLRYVFCGDGSERAALTTAAASLGDRVIFAGFRRDVAACLAAADVVAMPSLHEGLGVAALEAMAAARPLVASRVGGLAEVVVDGQSGVLVPPGDADALAAALHGLACDPALRDRLARGGRARVLERFTAARMAEGTLACYGRAPCAV